MPAEVLFAGGCFWCTESDLKKMEGVIDVLSGYIGDEGSPSYYSHKGYREGVSVKYDLAQTSYKKLCQFFLDHIDPTDAGGQFNDRGESYKTAIFYENDEEREIVLGLLNELEGSGLYDEPIAVEVLPKQNFYTAEAEHQRYAEKNPAHYEAYRQGSGRADFVGRTCMIRNEKKIKWRE